MKKVLLFGKKSPYGPELVPDPTFSSADGWTLKSNTTISGGQLTIDTTGDSNWYINAQVLPVPTVVGKTYKYIIDIETNTDWLWLIFGNNIADSVSFNGTTGIFEGTVTIQNSADPKLHLEDRHSTTGLYVINYLSVKEVL